MKIVKVKTGDYGRCNKVRLFVFHRNERVLDNLINRRFRPQQIYREEVLPKVFKKLGLTDVDAKWSQFAGCSCGCSPGFILDRSTEVCGYGAVYVTVSGKPETI